MKFSREGADRFETLPAVVIQGLSRADAALVKDIVGLQGGDVLSVDQLNEAGADNICLWITGDEEIFQDSQNQSESMYPPTVTAVTDECSKLAVRISIGSDGMFSLPRDESLIKDVIAQCFNRKSFPIIGVSGWEGGAGATTYSRVLAATFSGVKRPTDRPVTLVDVSGPGSGLLRPHEEMSEGIRWADLDGNETSWGTNLRDSLPRVENCHVLTGDRRGGALPGDKRVPGVLLSLSTRSLLVVDLGRWGQTYLGQAVPQAINRFDAHCLIGRGDEDSLCRLAAVLAVCPVMTPYALIFTTRVNRRLVQEILNSSGTIKEGFIGTFHLPHSQSCIGRMLNKRRHVNKVVQQLDEGWQCESV